jgi:DNA-binding transcriptional ArsR family regulator
MTPRPAPTPRPGVRTISDAKALSALANPYRSRLLDALHLDGPSTASALSRRTGQAVGSVSHHLKVLADAGLIEEVPELAKDRRERWWRLVSTGFRWSRAEFADDPSAVAAALSAESITLRQQFERARDWLDNHEAAGEWGDAAFATQYWLTLTPDELRQLNEELLGLLHRWKLREVPTDGAEREPILIFARAFPAQP